MNASSSWLFFSLLTLTTQLVNTLEFGEIDISVCVIKIFFVLCDKTGEIFVWIENGKEKSHLNGTFKRNPFLQFMSTMPHTFLLFDRNRISTQTYTILNRRFAFNICNGAKILLYSITITLRRKKKKTVLLPEPTKWINSKDSLNFQKSPLFKQTMRS